jgi:hypothetical protein
MFSGLIECATCGKKHRHNRAKSIDKNAEGYVCGTYRDRRENCTPHSMRIVILEKLVLEHLRNVLSFAKDYEDEFVQSVMNDSVIHQKKELKQKQHTLGKLKKRNIELDGLYKRIYEDNYSGKLSDERFTKISSEYEQEQADLKPLISALEIEIAEKTEKSVNLSSFLNIVQRYTNITELNATILREFIEKIIIHERVKENGQTIQQVDIVYNFIGIISTSENENMVESA